MSECIYCGREIVWDLDQPICPNCWQKDEIRLAGKDD